MGTTVFSLSGDRPIDRFSFDYQLVGDATAKPLQVFDDGKKTYLQYRSNQDIPAFITASTGELMLPTQSGPYTVLEGVPRDFLASMGSSSARITHASAMSNAAQYVSRTNPSAVPTQRINPQEVIARATQAAAVAPSYQPRNDWSDNSYATPRRGDQVAWTPTVTESSKVILFERGSAKLTRDAERRARTIAAEIVGATRVVISASDDAKPSDVGGAERARVIRNYLIAAGVNPSSISSKVSFSFDDQLQKLGSKLMNPTTVTWYVESAPANRSVARGNPSQDDPMAIVAMLRAGKITPSQAAQMLQTSVSSPASMAGQIDARESASRAPSQTSWTIRKEDQTVQKMLTRWGQEAGWSVVWRGAPLVQITADAERPLVHPDFLKAADYVVTQAKGAGYQIKATAFTNKVLLVTGE
jgi:outer membrane protein OmpA-like peptidoglycan-associated protein